MCLLQVYFTSMVQWCEERLKAYNLEVYNGFELGHLEEGSYNLDDEN